MNYINCGWCGVQVVKKNSLHKYCTAKCKKKAWRKKNGKPEYPTFINKQTQRPERKQLPVISPEYFLQQPKKRRVVRRVNRSNIKSIVERTEPNTEPKIESKNEYYNKFDGLFDDYIESQRKLYKGYSFYSNKDVEKELKELRPEIKRVHKGLRKLDKALKLKRKEMSKVKIFKKTDRQINSQIMKYRMEEEKKIKNHIKNGHFNLISNYFFFI